MPDTIDTPQHPAGRELYEADEHEWIAAQISALSRGDFGRLDCANLIEYLSEMTIRDRRELKSRLIVLLHDLLKVRVRPDKLKRSWIATIIEQQSEIRSIIESIPSPGRQADAIASTAYPNAVRRASGETGVQALRFPPALPWTVAEALAYDPPDAPAPRSRRG
jgi:hypothetical protein